MIGIQQRAGMSSATQEMDAKVAVEIVVLYLAASMRHSIDRSSDSPASDDYYNRSPGPAPLSAIYLFHYFSIGSREWLSVSVVVAAAPLNLEGEPCDTINDCRPGLKYRLGYIPVEELRICPA